MASSLVAQAPIDPDGTKAAEDLESFQRLQYEKIVQFHDAIISGKHPTIGASETRGQSFSDANIARSDLGRAGQVESASAANLPATAKFNPILLQKSDELISAEIKLQRQRLERALKDEVDQRRARKHAHPETPADLDLSDVLARALDLVQATSPALPANDNLTANTEAASDSFDDDTFYSSQHDTPDPPRSSQNAIEPQSNHVITSASTEKHQAARHVESVDHSSYQSRRNEDAQVVPTAATAQSKAGGLIPGLNNYTEKRANVGKGQNHVSSAPYSQTDDSGNVESDQRDNSARRSPYAHDDIYGDSRPPSPLVRDNERVARPAEAAHSTNASMQASFGYAPTYAGAVAPAQVAALRNNATSASSPESSPHGGRSSDKKKAKKKKRKAAKEAQDGGGVPYIKPEPRSPSPLMPETDLRPPKRQKQSQRGPYGPGQEESRYEPPLARSSQQQYDPRFYQDVPATYVHGASGVYSQRAPSVVAVEERGYPREYHDDRRFVGEAQIPVPYSPSQPSLSYAASGRATSHFVPTHTSDDRPRLYFPPYDQHHSSARTEGGYTMVPAPPPTRIYVDATGREYLEPPRPLVRQSVAPSFRSGEPDSMVYDRPPVRAVSRQPYTMPYEDRASVMYARASPARGMPRRVVTQPEYEPQSLRDQRHREYSMRPADDPATFQSVPGGPPATHGEGSTQRYRSTAPSMHPTEHVRYEIPQNHERLSGARPAPDSRAYAGDGHAREGQLGGQTYMRDNGVHSMDPHTVRADYSGRPPVERYYEPQVQRVEEVAYVQRPNRGAGEYVYADPGSRAVYR